MKEYREASDWFWEIVEQVGGESPKLAALLLEMTKDQIYKFQYDFITASVDLMDSLFAPYLPASDDGAEDVCRWIVSQGKSFYLNVYNHPETVAEYQDKWSATNLFGVAYTVYEEKFGEDLDLD